MTETMHRNGWRQEETDLLWKEIRTAAENGDTLRDVFERMGHALGRKPNSVRNYYYMQLRDQAGDELRRAAPFETFTQEEVHDLLRHVLMARGKGQSVRACVMDLSDGNKTLMLRYQNKYRSILRKKPEMIDQVCRELAQEGLPCPQAAVIIQPGTRETQESDDPDVRIILTALQSLARRARQGKYPENDRLKVQRDLLAMQLEDLQSAAKAMVADCKDFLGEPAGEKPVLLDAFCETLAHHVAQLESVSG